MDQESQGTKYPKVLLLSLLVILVGAVGYYFYTSYEPPVNHLIEGVPYYGVYNLYPDFTSSATSIAIILRYYNDERVSFGELKNNFPDSRHDTDDLSHFRNSLSFFETQGYNTFSLGLASKKGKEINEIKKYINKDIPVIVIQQKRLDTKIDDIERFGWRVVIGVFDDKREVVVHDASLGNNYVLSYSDFEKLFVPGARRMLAVWPKADLVISLTKPGNGKPYPERSTVMENTYSIVGAAGRAKAAAAAADALCVNTQGNLAPEQINEFVDLHKESVRYRDEVINSQVFTRMSPLFQFRNKLWRARSMMLTGEVSKARGILVKELIPINKGLDKTAEDFSSLDSLDGLSDSSESSRYSKVINGQMPYVYELLMLSYRYENKNKEAIDAYLPYFKLAPNDKDALRKLSGLKDPVLNSGIPQFVRCMGGRSMIK